MDDVGMGHTVRRGAATKRAMMKARRRMKANRKRIDGDEDHGKVEDDCNKDCEEGAGEGGTYLSLLEHSPEIFLSLEAGGEHRAVLCVHPPFPL